MGNAEVKFSKDWRCRELRRGPREIARSEASKYFFLSSLLGGKKFIDTVAQREVV